MNEDKPLVTVEQRVQWTIADVMRLQNLYKELIRSIEVLNERVEKLELERKR